MSTPASDRATAGIEPALRVCPGGPVLVRGPSSVTTGDGTEQPVRRPVVALCRCGRSRRRPYCDGTHKLVRRRPAAPDAG